MARIRTIKPEFWQDEKLAPLDPITRLVFLGLISQADDAGRLVDSVRMLDGLLFPFTDDSCEGPLCTLDELGVIERGTTASGQAVIQIVNWQHQKIDKPNLSAALPEIAVPQRHPRRVPPKLREAIYERDGGVCQNCGVAVHLDKPHRYYGGGDDLAEVDHILALADGGTNDPANLQLLCKKCNRRKAGDALIQRNLDASAKGRGSIGEASAPHISTGTSTTDQLPPTAEPRARVAGDGEHRAECIRYVEHRGYGPKERLIAEGEDVTAWTDTKTGDRVPWDDRLRLLKLADARVREKESPNLRSALKYVILQQYDPVQGPTAEELEARPKPGTEAAAIRSEYPQEAYRTVSTRGLEPIAPKPEPAPVRDIAEERIRRWEEEHPHEANELRERIASRIARGGPDVPRSVGAKQAWAKAEFRDAVLKILKGEAA